MKETLLNAFRDELSDLKSHLITESLLCEMKCRIDRLMDLFICRSIIKDHLEFSIERDPTNPTNVLIIPENDAAKDIFGEI